MTISTDEAVSRGLAVLKDPPDDDSGGPHRLSWRPSRAVVKTTLKLIPLGLIVVLAIFGPLFETYDPRKIVGQPNLAPSGTFLFGTDNSGFDVFSRVISGTRIDLLIGLFVTFIATVVGVTIGLLIGMNESKRGPLGMIARGVARGLDLVQAIPAIVVGLVVVAFYGASAMTLTFAIAIIVSPIQARLVRTEVLRVRSEAYLEAGRISGLSEFELTVRHVLPNSSWPAVDNTAFVFGVAILLTSSLGFLGVGLPPPTPEWGSMLATGAPDAVVGRWWSSTFPTIALALAVSSVAFAYSVYREHRK